MSVYHTLRAASRLTPRMAAYQLKRLFRNAAVPKVAAVYDRRVHATAIRLPLPKHCDRIPPDLANFVGAYYRQPDAQISDAARGRFTIHGRTVDFGSIAGIDWYYRLPDEGDGCLWRLELNQLGVLHSLICSGEADRHSTAIELIESFRRSRTFGSKEVFTAGWAPYGASNRLLEILSGLSVASRNEDISPDARKYLEEFARLEAGFLWLNVEYELRNNHTERNLAALCLYHLGAGSISSARAKLLDREVRRIIRETVLEDGMQVERSAMYQGLTVMSLRIFENCPFLSVGTRELASDRYGAAVRAWLFLTHGDGEIALFNDSWIGHVPSPLTIVDVDSVTLPPSLPDAGYWRLSSGSVVAILDAGEIGPHCSPAHGHADFLAVEIDVGGRRFIVDPGTSQYSTGRRRSFERSAASHNGPRYSGVEPVQYLGAFRVGKLNRRVGPLDSNILSQLSVAAVGGRLETRAGSCTRVVCAAPSGGFVIVDRWGSPQPAGVTNILISAEWEIAMRKATDVYASTGDIEIVISAYQGQIKGIEASTWSRHYMRTERAHSITFEPDRKLPGIQQLILGVGVVQPSEVADILNEVEGNILLW